MRILFVCSGNICRSPTAEGVMRRLVREAGLEGEVEVDSAALGPWHVGEAPDPRAVAAAAARGLALEGRARQVGPDDLRRFDLVLGMDRGHLRDLRRMAPDGTADRVRLLRDFDPAAREAGDLEVADPYYGGEDGFEEVLDQVEAACRGLLAELRPGRHRRPA
jgi:protein-tyrosine phosphatase